jgi:hypothetical protein
MGASIGIELLPEWAPSLNPAHARFDVLVTVPAGAAPVDPSTLRVELRDAAGEVVGTIAAGLDEHPAPVTGPGWRVITGRHVAITDEIAHAEAVVGAARSRRTSRADARRTLNVVPIRDVLGVPGEPRLWWRFCNTTDAPIAVSELLDDTVVWLDDVAVQPPATYNGPAQLPPGRAISNLVSLSDLGITISSPSEITVSILGHRFGPIPLVDHA